eukprot:335477_1
MDSNANISLATVRSKVLHADKDRLQYMILCAMKDNSELIQQFHKYSMNYDARPHFKKNVPPSPLETDLLSHKTSLYHKIGSKQQSYIVIKSYIKNIQKLLPTQIIPIDIIDLCFQYYHFVEIHIKPIQERDFYKKYWIQTNVIGHGRPFGLQTYRQITRKSDKRQCALKMIKKKGKTISDIEALQKEILILQSCIHPNIIGFSDWCDTKKRIYIIQEYCDGGNILKRISNSVSEQYIVNIIKQVTSALSHIHCLGYVHRDIKTNNIMYFTKDIDSMIKIVDFSTVGDCYKDTLNVQIGSSYYVAPEILLCKEYNQSVDMWSLGVIIYILLCGFPPFFDVNLNDKTLYDLIKKGEYSFRSPFWDNVSEYGKDLIRKLLVVDSDKRMTAKKMLKHSWIANNGCNKSFGEKYVKQMRHWESIQSQTVWRVGFNLPPSLQQRIKLYYGD